MMKLIITAGFALAVAFPSVAKDVFWGDLVPQLPEFNDPFKALSPDQLYDLAIIARYKQRERLSEQELTENVRLVSRLEEDGVDIEYLFEKRQEVMEHRRKLAMSPNDSLADRLVSLPGFVTPLEFDGEKVVKFFFVPSAGACIHTPPPPANQIVLVDYPAGVTLMSLQQPFVIKGEIEISQINERVNYADGATDVDSVYKMKAQSVEQYIN
ncbi:DUF3299 domain-containing protein [Vibrio hangzhouensis]|uniref:DUF3299 domain-containing protein n=1 Tax=Vibrio hangzhouensis TaxID=462991 RepID=UPI001C95377B|nr:DUF3299 domain-containing protein [Vibrio hangzhouensis]MBY6197735.1 DUF3299 domain-containing protein [Vibrio hangzhouensis]